MWLTGLSAADLTWQSSQLQGTWIFTWQTRQSAIFGIAAASFEAQLQTVNDVADWTMRGLEDLRLTRARELFSAGMSVRDVGEELGVSKTTAQRLKTKLAHGVSQ